MTKKNEDVTIEGPKDQNEKKANSQDEMVGRVQDRMTQTPPKKIPWKTYILLFVALVAFFWIMTLAF